MIHPWPKKQQQNPARPLCSVHRAGPTQATKVSVFEFLVVWEKNLYSHQLTLGPILLPVFPAMSLHSYFSSILSAGTLAFSQVLTLRLKRSPIFGLRIIMVKRALLGLMLGTTLVMLKMRNHSSNCNPTILQVVQSIIHGSPSLHLHNTSVMFPWPNLVLNMALPNPSLTLLATVPHQQSQKFQNVPLPHFARCINLYQKTPLSS